nr:RNA-directed DNA polymerase, eukaryota [Tanacetum cinerariifolium]
SLKRTLWSYLSSLINRWNGECILLGEFNEVRRKEERWGSTFNVYGARDFNQFVTSAGLVEVQLEGIRANLAVKCVMIEGEWVDDPSKVKDEFRDYFASRFCDPGICHGVINFNFPNCLNIDQSRELEAPISRDEIRRAVWDCGENKSPGPDGFTFEFFRRFWNIIGHDLCLAVEWFFHHASFPIGCNSSFFALI